MKKTEVNYLKGLIIAKGYTVKEIANKLKLSRPRLSLKVNGKAKFNQDEIVKLVNILEIPNEEIAKYFF